MSAQGKAEPTVAPQGIPLSPRWVPADDLPLVLAEHLHLALINNQYYLTFGQVNPPVHEHPTPGAPANIRPIARIVVPKASLPGIVRLLKQAVDEWGDSE